MTREEAIKILNFQRGYFCDLKGCEEQQAFTMAIQALEQEPCDDAIKHFKNVYELSQTLGVPYDFVDEKIQEIVMALKKKPLALSPVTPQPCDDVISRQAALDLAKFDGRENLGSIIHAFDVEQLPPVNPAEKVGQWILLDKCSNSGYYCSECQKKVVKEGWSNTVKKIKYCPNCGAKMEGEE